MQGRRYSEIGSEFWLEKFPHEYIDYVLSGRTAIDLILQDVMTSGHKVSSVYMPAWCCDSMLQPFLDREIEVDFYDVSLGTENDGLVYHIDTHYTADILYVTNYFGYDNSLGTEIIEAFKPRGTLVIYDRTHSLFREMDNMAALADYHFGSIRKWLGVICGAYLAKKGDELRLPYLQNCPYLGDKRDAMAMKTAYMAGDDMDKQSFMRKYSSFGHAMSKDYRNYKMDAQSLYIWHHTDKHALCERRRDNAACLQSGIDDLLHVKLLFHLKEKDCPLFVPVIFESQTERDKMRQHLINHAIYCPIHWPKPSNIETSSKCNDLYSRELSIVCDQRYDVADMQHIVNTIKDFYH